MPGPGCRLSAGEGRCRGIRIVTSEKIYYQWMELKGERGREGLNGPARPGPLGVFLHFEFLHHITHDFVFVFVFCLI